MALRGSGPERLHQGGSGGPAARVRAPAAPRRAGSARRCTDGVGSATCVRLERGDLLLRAVPGTPGRRLTPGSVCLSPRFASTGNGKKTAAMAETILFDRDEVDRLDS